MRKRNKITRIIRNLFVDLRYGKFLGGVKKTKFASHGASDTANSDYLALAYIFKGRIFSSEYVFVDVGCGKGRVLNYWLDNYSIHRLIGIELDPEIASQTAKRLEKYKNVTIIEGDVINLLPKEPALFYMFNPFNCQVMNQFKCALFNRFYDEKSGWQLPFEIIYYNPKCLDVFLDKNFSFIEIELPTGFHKCVIITQSSTT
jgi:SAM-dependent methyltransferase